MATILEHVQRRLRVIGYDQEQRRRLGHYRAIVERIIDDLVVSDFARAFEIHPRLQDGVEPIARELYAAEAAHFRLLFDGDFDQRYCDSLERLTGLERQANVGARARASIAFTLFRVFLEDSRVRYTFTRSRLRKDLYLIERLLTYDVNTAMSLDRQAEIEEATRRSLAIDAVASTLRDHVSSLDGMMGATAGQFSATARDTSAATDFIAAQVASVARSAELMREKAMQTAAATEEMSANIAEIDERARTSLSVAERAVVDAQAMNQAIGRLNAVTGSIEAVVGLIADIAAQTNLLALNATIEAARAGDAGRGFAVVASEVKSLATQTASATQDIARQIAELATSAAVCGDHAGAIGDTIAEVRAASGAISDSVGQQSVVTLAIARDAAEVARNSDEAMARAHAVNASLGRTAHALARANEAAAHIAEQVGAAEAAVASAVASLRAAS